MTRIDRLRRLIEEPLLVTMPVNVFYLTGFRSSNAALLVDDARALLFSDFRYARSGAPGRRGRVHRGRARTRPRGRQRMSRDAWRSSGRISRTRTGRCCATQASTSCRAAVRSSGCGPSRRRTSWSSSAVRPRSRTRLTGGCAEERFVGRTERDLAFTFAQFMHELGGHGEAFPTTVASGPNGATPHAGTSDRVVEKGETVVVDAGAVLDGYASDCTRTFATGPLPDELARAYDVVLEAQLEGLDAVAPG